MSRAYKFRNQELPYFITITVVKWVTLFTRKDQRNILIESLKYCQENKGLIIYSWVIMPNHLHLIIGTCKKPMEDIVRDFKSFTSRRIKEEIEKDPKNVRKEMTQRVFRNAGRNNSNNHKWQLWQQHNKPIELWDNYMIDQKLEYIHQNPVKAGYVNKPEHWTCSSAIDYCGGNGLLNVEILE